MKEIKREIYLNRLIRRRENGLIKVITGIRRSGKSYLLDPIFRNYLLSEGVREDHIIKIELDRESNRRYYHDPHAFDQYIHSFVKDEQMYYIILDEIQLVDDFDYILNGLLYEKNLDVYVTGSNSKFLSSDIITEFRGRGDQVRVQPLSFSEYLPACGIEDKYDAWNEYMTYGGMPFVVSIQDSQGADGFRYPVSERNDCGRNGQACLPGRYRRDRRYDHGRGSGRRNHFGRRCRQSCGGLREDPGAWLHRYSYSQRPDGAARAAGREQDSAGSDDRALRQLRHVVVSDPAGQEV